MQTEICAFDMLKFMKIFLAILAVMGIAACSGKSSSSAWKKNIDYVYYGGDCSSTNGKQCMNLTEYEAACKHAKGVTLQAIKIRGVNSFGSEKILIDGGSIKNVDVYWGKSSRGAGCGVTVAMQGHVNGNSSAIDVNGTATSFIVDNAGDLLVSQFNNY